MIILKTQEFSNSKERKFFILARLINGEHLSYHRLAEDYFVSRSSIANDIAVIKARLSKDNVPLLFNNSGSYIGGGEIDKQKIIKRVVIDLLKIEDEQQKGLTDLFLDTNLLQVILEVFHEKLLSWKLEVPENYVEDIAISTAILVFRGKNGNQISWKNKTQFNEIFAQFDKYPLVYQLLSSVEEKEIYHFNNVEMQYLSYIVIGNGFNFFMKDGQIPENFKNEVEKLIKNVGESLCIDLTRDAVLLSSLLVHLYQMEFRLQSKTTVINPMLAEIKESYSNLYGVVWYALSEFSGINYLTVSDDEVGFVTLHFQAAIERNKKINRILFVCPNGIGMSSLISAKIQRILPSAALTEVVSKHNLAKKDLSNVSLIISTVELSEQEVPVVNISPILTVKDMKNIANKYIDIVMKQKSKNNKSDFKSVLPLLKGNVIFTTKMSADQIIDLLLEKGKWANKQCTENYKKSVLNREKLQTTYLSNGFAIPHGDPSLLTESHIAVAVLDKSIYWGNNRVDIVAMLMIKQDDKKNVEPFMNLIMRGINDKEWFISKMMEAK